MQYQNIFIEIKSSLEKYSTQLNEIIEKRRIIDNKHLSHLNNSNIISQVFFIPKNKNHLSVSQYYENELKNLEYNNENIRKMVLMIYNNFDIYFMGWTTREILRKETSSFSVENSNNNSEKRSYTNFFLSQAFNNNTIKAYMNNEINNKIIKQKL